jgi:hypothetical protein
VTLKKLFSKKEYLENENDLCSLSTIVAYITSSTYISNVCLLRRRLYHCSSEYRMSKVVCNGVNDRIFVAIVVLEIVRRSSDFSRFPVPKILFEV